MKKYVIGIDAGTTGTKAMVVDLKGKVYGVGYRDYPLLHPKPNWVELDAANLTDQVVTVVGEAVKKSGVDPAEIAALSFSVQRSTFALVDENGDALENRFCVWLDTRSDEVLDEMNERIPHEERALITGMPSPAIFCVTKLYWFQKKRPDLIQKAKYISTVDGYLLKKFGAEEFCNEVTCFQTAGFVDNRTMELCDDVIDKLGLERRLFPKLVKPGEVVGSINPEIARRTGLTADTLIVAGSGDQQAGALGAGIISDGAVAITLGTGGFVIVGLAKPNFGKLQGLMVPSTPNLGVFEVEGNQNSGATCYRWARDTFFSAEAEEAQKKGIDPYDAMNELVEQSRPGSNGVIFSAALFGTGYPTWNSGASASFVGLKSTHTRGDVLRAVMEGITMETRFMLESIQNTGVSTQNIITVTGGAMRSPIWRQIVADIMGASIRTLEVADAAVIGVAGLAAIGAGLYRNVAEVAENMVHYGEVIDPIPENVAIYDKVFAAYKQVYYSLNNGKVFDMLNAIYE